MPVAYFPTQEEFQRSILAKAVTRSGITDVSDVAVLNTLAAALARQLDKISFAAQTQRQSWNIATAAGSDLDARALDYLPPNISRISAQYAGGLVTFGRANANSGSTVIVPQGTSVNDGAGNNFVTTQSVTFAPGNTALTGQQTVTVNVQALVPGSAANVAASAIVAFGSKPSGVDTVTNPSAMTGGADQESDDSFRQRIYASVGSLSRGTSDAITTALLGLQSGTQTILSCSVVTDPTQPGTATIYIDNGSGTFSPTTTAVTGEVVTQGLAGPPVNTAVGGEQWLGLNNYPVSMSNAVTLTSTVGSTSTTLVYGVDYHLDQTTGSLFFPLPLQAGQSITASYTYFGGIVALAQKVVSGDPNNRLTYPGVAAAGIQAVVTLPSPVFISISMDVAVANGYDSSSNAGSVPNLAMAAALSVANALPVGAPLYLNALVAAVMNVPGVNDVIFTSPTSDVLASDGEIIRATAGTV